VAGKNGEKAVLSVWSSLKYYFLNLKRELL